MTTQVPERKLALIHRVIVPDENYPKEYAILITDRRSIFIRQEKTRNTFVLRREMKYGTALITDVVLKTLKDYDQGNTEALSSDPANITISHESVISLVLKKEMPKPGKLDFFVRMTMRKQQEIFQVYNLELSYWENPNSKAMIKFYLVPLGAYFKPRRQTQTRETILKEYALETLETFRKALPGKISQ